MKRACPLCQCEAASTYLAADARKNLDQIELRKCAECGFVFSAKAEFVYDELFYDSFVNRSKEDLLSRARSDGVDKLVAEIVHKTRVSGGAHIMDFGAGIGLTSLFFQQHDLDVVVVEASKKYVERHPSLGIKSFRSIDEARQSNDSFDLVVMKDVLEHVSNPRDVLAQAIVCIKPGGYFYVRVPNVLAYPFHWAIDTKGHINHFRPKDLFGLLTKHGFQKVDFVGVYDIRSRAGKTYHTVFWPIRKILPMYHQISVLFRRP